MPQPAIQDVHIDSLLTNVSVAYFQAPSQKFIAPQVFPVIPVDKQSNKYLIYNKNDWFRDEAQKRADSTESVGSGFNLSNTSYQADVWAIHKDIGDQLLANADSVLNLSADASRFVMQRLMLRMELQWIADFFKTGVWGTNDLTGVAGVPAANQFRQWSDYTNSDPINDIETGKENILSVTGFMPNTLVMGYQVFRQLQNHPDLIDRYKYTQSSVITEELMARLFGVERILVSRAIYATNNEGETAAYSFITGKNALLLYVPPSPGLLTPSAGYTFVWTGVSGGLQQPVVIRRFRIEEKRCERVEGEMAFANKVVGADLGQFYATAVA